MKRTAVSSSNLASVGYDPARQSLEIEFTTGRVYEYFDVPQQTCATS
ncbi:MAG: KTSC domain-containing protein [Chloroflexi bacterium]|nr:KTSC domain-containing protein [Chloroflexota bacterium]